MKIRDVGEVFRFPEDKKPDLSKLRDPQIEDLPRVKGKEVPPEKTSNEIRSLLSLILGIGEKNDK